MNNCKEWAEIIENMAQELWDIAAEMRADPPEIPRGPMYIPTFLETIWDRMGAVINGIHHA